MKHLLSILLTLAAIASCGRPFELYQPIIDRCPFGDPPDDPTVSPDLAAKSSGKTPQDVEEAELTQQQAELQQTVGVSVMNISPDGSVWVGFSVMGDQKNMKHYYLVVGDQRDGWLVKEADPSTGTVTFVKDSIEVPRKVGDSLAKSNGRGGGRQMPQRGGMGRSPLVSGRPMQAMHSDMQPAMKSHRQLRREQDEAERKARLEQTEAIKKLQEEENRRREEEKAERDAEREADKEEMRRNLMDMQEQLRRAREERRQREAEGGGEGHEANE